MTIGDFGRIGSHDNKAKHASVSRVKDKRVPVPEVVKATPTSKDVNSMTKADFEAALNDVNWSIEAYRSELEMTDVMSERYTELLELIEIAEEERDNIQDNIDLLSGEKVNPVMRDFYKTDYLP